MAPTDTELLTQLNVAIIRLDDKVTHVLEALRDLRMGHQDHETRLRVIEAAYATRTQLKEVENKPTVSPGTMWKVAGVLGTALTFLFSVIAFLITTMK